jgi:cation diffusion facilitator CzcD-associated flavoprotein CzcO
VARQDNGDQVIDVVVVGAGFAGLCLLHRLRGDGRSVRVFEAGGGVGGTWYWNRYPGARCDVPSMEYSLGISDDLQQEWVWTERYAPQDEILRYLDHVADRFDLRRDIHFDARVRSATFDEATATWKVVVDPVGSGSDRPIEVTARFVIMATGCLSSANIPAFPGIGSFQGETFHTGQWPHDGVDFAGKRVGVIGTGSSGVQSIPIIAERAGELVVFQRTATYTVPAHNSALDLAEQDAIKADYAGLRAANRASVVGFGGLNPGNDVSALAVTPEERLAQFEQRWERGGLAFLGAFNDLLIDPASNELIAEFVRDKIRATVHDPEVAELLCPKTVIGCKRLCVDSGYYETFNRPNVRLVDVSEHPIDEITPDGIRVGDETYELDVIVFATGFDAMTGALNKIDIVGRGGATLRDAWAEGPRTLLGIGVAGFPNLFLVTGPGSPSVLTNMVTSIEHHTEWIADCITHLRTHGLASIEATGPAQDAWVDYVNAVASFTLYPGCNSWYLGANVPGKPRVFMPLIGFAPYAVQCEDVATDGYRGFELTPA